MNCLHDLELFLHDKPVATSPLIKAGLAHVQFETIHPFLDGNGRVGRLLIALILCSSGVLREPLLYPSLYFKTHRDEYYDRLDRVRSEGDWEGWMAFYAQALRDTANDAVTTARELGVLVARDRAAVSAKGRVGPQLQVVHSLFSEYPMQTVKNISAKTGLVPNTVSRTLEALQHLGIVSEITGKKRNRLYLYKAYFDRLNRTGLV
jgi:Fic family protein